MGSNQLKQLRQGFLPSRTIVIIAIIVMLLIFVVMIPGILFPQYERIATTGEYSTDTVTLTLVDQSRDELFTAAPDHRKVQVAFWYPQTKLENELFPLIIFSHGGLGTITSNESLYLELASHGFVVCSIGHPFHALRTVNEDGSITWVNKEYFRELQVEDPQKDKMISFSYYQKWMQTRTEDISFVMDRIIQNKINPENDVFILIDVEKIGIMGHSLGGSAALAMPRIRDDVDLVVALESPYLFDIVGVENGEFVWRDAIYQVPVLNVYSDSSWENLSKWPQYARNAAYLTDSNQTISNLYIPGAGHYSLTDLSLASPFIVRFLEGTQPIMDYREYLQQVNSAVLKFFEQNLKD